jgi:hypothetical protein
MPNLPFHSCRKRSQTPIPYSVQTGWTEVVLQDQKITIRVPKMTVAYGLDSVKECRYDVSDDPACKGCTISRAVMPMRAFKA